MSSPLSVLRKFEPRGTRRTPGVGVVAAASARALALAACGSGTSSSSSSSSHKGASIGLDTTITVAESDTPDTLDPQKTGAAVTASILQYVGDTLVALDPYTQKVVPDLATSWTISRNKLVYTFQLRHGVTFQDGTPFNAQAMQYTLRRAMNPATHGNIATADLASVSSVAATGPYTLKLTLKQPYAPLLTTALSSPDLMAISPTAVKKEGAKFADHPVGTGPMSVSSYVPGKSVTLVRNPAYHWAPSFFTNKGPVRFGKLVIDFLPTTSTVVDGLRTGSIGIAATVPAQQIGEFEHNPSYRVTGSYKQGLGLYVVMNTAKAPLNQVGVRQAINYAINRSQVVKLALDGAGAPAYSPLPPTIAGYDPASPTYGYHYDPSKARKLLAAAGYHKGPNGYLTKDGSTLDFTFYSSPVAGWSSAAAVIQQDLQAVGIETTIKSMDIGTLITDMEKGEQDLGLMSYVYADPDVLYLFFDSTQIGTGLNMSQYRNPHLDTLLAEGRATTATAARVKVYHEIQRYMVQQAVIAPVYNLKLFTVVSNSLKGVSVAPGNIIELQDVG